MQSVWAEFSASDKKDGGQLKSNENNCPGVGKKIIDLMTMDD